jgi:glucose/arabinose dehydrogenase
MTRNSAIRVRDLPQLTTFYPVISMKKTLLFACILAGSAQADVQQRFGEAGGTGIALAGNLLYATAGNSIVRPVGLAQAPDGSLFITDDTGGTIWRVSYRATPR